MSSVDRAVVDVDVSGKLKMVKTIAQKNDSDWDCQPVLGRQIAANKSYICYALKEGIIRVLDNHGLTKDCRGHTQRVTDMAFFADDVHLLASVSVEGLLFVWKISEGLDEEGTSQTIADIVIAIQIQHEGEAVHPRVCWHCSKQEVLFVGVGKHVLRIDTAKVAKGDVLSAEDPIKCPVEQLIDGVQSVVIHDGEVTDLSMCQCSSRLVSASMDGTINIWDDRKPQPLKVLRPCDGLPVYSAIFVTPLKKPAHTILVTAGPFNREVKIWSSTSEVLKSDDESWKCTHALELKSSAQPRDEDAFFNQVIALSQAGLLLLANAKKNAIYAVHIDFGFGPAAPHMDHIAEFTVTMPILSFTGTSISPHGEQVVQIYCVQTQAIQQYALDLSNCVFLPLEDKFYSVFLEHTKQVFGSYYIPSVGMNDNVFNTWIGESGNAVYSKLVESTELIYCCGTRFYSSVNHRRLHSWKDWRGHRYSKEMGDLVDSIWKFWDSFPAEEKRKLISSAVSDKDLKDLQRFKKKHAQVIKFLDEKNPCEVACSSPRLALDLSYFGFADTILSIEEANSELFNVEWLYLILHGGSEGTWVLCDGYIAGGLLEKGLLAKCKELQKDEQPEDAVGNTCLKIEITLLQKFITRNKNRDKNARRKKNKIDSNTAENEVKEDEGIPEVDDKGADDAKCFQIIALQIQAMQNMMKKLMDGQEKFQKLMASDDEMFDQLLNEIPTLIGNVKNELADVRKSCVSAFTLAKEQSQMAPLASEVGDKAVNQVNIKLNALFITFQNLAKFTLESVIATGLRYQGYVPFREVSSFYDRAFRELQYHTEMSTRALVQHFAKSPFTEALKETIRSTKSLPQIIRNSVAVDRENILANFTAKMLLLRLVSEEKYEEAFRYALTRADRSIVVWLCTQLNPHYILSLDPLPFNIPTMALLHGHLADNYRLHISEPIAYGLIVEWIFQLDNVVTAIAGTASSASNSMHTRTRGSGL